MSIIPPEVSVPRFFGDDRDRKVVLGKGEDGIVTLTLSEVAEYRLCP